jgi:hypothetical protein
MRLGTIVCALREIDPVGAHVSPGDVGVVVEEARDEFGPRVRWLAVAPQVSDRYIGDLLAEARRIVGGGPKPGWNIENLMVDRPVRIVTCGTCNISPQSVEVIGMCAEFDPALFDT